ncbi:MAG: hypothetical protein AB1391_03915 [Candidatus Micrarchaeota archaeon]
MADIDIKLGAVLLLALISAYFIVYYFGLLDYDERPTSYVQFINDLSAANKVFILMDLRNCSNDFLDLRNVIMQCGIDLAGSVALAPKNVSAFAIEDNVCISEKGNLTINECEKIFSSGVLFHIKRNNSTNFYKNKIIIGISDKNASCSVSYKKIDYKK